MASLDSLGIPQMVGTNFAIRFGRLERLASNGAPRIVARQSAPKFDIQVVYSNVTQTQRDAIVNFYNANSTVSFTFTPTEDGTQRNYVFAAIPYKIDALDYGFNVTLSLVHA